MGAPNTRASYRDLLLPGLREVFGNKYPIFDKGSVEKLYTIQKSEKDREKVAITAGTGLAQVKPEGRGITLDNIQQSHTNTVFHLTWATGLEFTEESMEDNLYLDLYPVAGENLARSMAYTREVQGADFWNNPTDSTNYACYTVGGSSYPLLSATHYRVDGGTWSNRLATAALLGRASYQKLLQQWTTGMLDLRGMKCNFEPETLVVSGNDEFQGAILIHSTHQPGTADNDINPAAQRRNISLYVHPHLSTAGQWFVCASKMNMGTRHYDRVKATLRREGVFNTTGNQRFLTRARYSHQIPWVAGIAGSPAS